MKRNMSLVLVALAIAAVFSLVSCDPILSLFNKPPKVSLAITKGTSTVNNDVSIEVTATVSDPDDDSYTLSWYLDDENLNYGEKVGYYTPSGYLADKTVTLKVVAKDEHGDSGSGTLSINVKATATIRVSNSTGSSVTYLRTRASGASSYGSDLLGGASLSNGYYIQFTGVSAGTYDFQWYIGSSSYSFASLAASKGAISGLRLYSTYGSTYTPTNSVQSVASMNAYGPSMAPVVSVEE